MSNYSKTTDFAAKDALSTGNANKIVKGTEIDDEFDAIQTAVNSKADTNNAALTGTPTAPTASAATNSTQIGTTAYVTSAITTAVAAAKAALFPVGTIYTQAAVATNPATLLGFGTWVSFGAGRVMVGIDGSDTAFDTLEETGGSADAIVVSHTHTATSTVTDTGHKHLSAQGTEFPSYGSSGTADGPNGLRSGDPHGFTETKTTGVTVATSIASAGSSGTDANLQPYIVVYMWKRTA
jgi:hypothetical protein